MKKVSRVIWESFNDCKCFDENTFMVVDHKDENKLNNNLDNLQCITDRENKIKSKKKRNKNVYNLDDNIKREIIGNYRSGIWSSTDVLKKYNIPSNYLFSVISRGTWDRLLQNDANPL